MSLLKLSLDTLRHGVKSVKRELKGSPWLTWLSQFSPLTQKLIIGTSVTFSLLIVHQVYSKFYCWKNRVPPGLFGVPYFGSMFTLMVFQKRFHSKILPKYGPITYYKIGQTEMLTLNDALLIQTIFKHETCRNRPKWLQNVFTKSLGHYQVSIAATNGPQWSQRRKNIVNGIMSLAQRDFIIEQVYHFNETLLFKEIDSHILKNENWFVTDDMRNASFNIAFGGIFGKQHMKHKTHKDYISIDTSINNLLKNVLIAALSEFVPLFGITGLLIKKIYVNIKNCIDSGTDTIKSIAKIAEKEHIENKNNGIGNITLYDELYENMLENSKYTNEMLIMDIWAMISAGIDTTGEVMEASLLYIAKYPKLQEEIYKELLNYSVENEDSGYKRFNISNLNKCIKFRAFVNESLRMAMPADLGALRSLTQNGILSFNIDKTNGKCINAEFETLSNHNKGNISEKKSSKFMYNYIITTDMIIEANLGHASHPSKNFEINRWIIKSNNTNKNEKFNKHYGDSMPFSVGVRDCPGKVLAQRELYSFLANLFLNYQLKPANGQTPNDIKIEYVQGFVKEVFPKVPLRVSKR